MTEHLETKNKKTKEKRNIEKPIDEFLRYSLSGKKHIGYLSIQVRICPFLFAIIHSFHRYCHSTYHGASKWSDSVSTEVYKQDLGSEAHMG